MMISMFLKRILKTCKFFAKNLALKERKIKYSHTI